MHGYPGVACLAEDVLGGGGFPFVELPSAS
jgi:hypothetical protein